MSKPRNGLQTGVRRAIVLLTCAALTTYFAIHAISGRHGFETRSRLLATSARLKKQAARLEVVRSRLQRDVALLDGPTPHPDIIAETAAKTLGFFDPGVIVVPID